MPHHFAVWRTSSRCSDGFPYLSTVTAAQDARWPSPQADLTNMAILSDPTQTSGKAELCDHARSLRRGTSVSTRRLSQKYLSATIAAGKYLSATVAAGKMKGSCVSGLRNEHVDAALRHDKRILPLLMQDIEEFFCKREIRYSQQAQRARPGSDGHRLSSVVSSVSCKQRTSVQGNVQQVRTVHRWSHLRRPDASLGIFP